MWSDCSGVGHIQSAASHRHQSGQNSPDNQSGHKTVQHHHPVRSPTSECRPETAQASPTDKNQQLNQNAGPRQRPVADAVPPVQTCPVAAGENQSAWLISSCFYSCLFLSLLILNLLTDERARFETAPLQHSN